MKRDAQSSFVVAAKHLTLRVVWENIGLSCRVEGDFSDPYLNSAVNKTNLPLSKISLIIYHFWFILRT